MANLCTCLGAIYSKKECVLPLNALRFGAKCLAFWCKMPRVLVLNGVRFGAKCKVKWCKMQGEKHKYPLQMV